MKSSEKKLTKDQQWFADIMGESMKKVFDDWWEKQKKLKNLEILKKKL